MRNLKATAVSYLNTKPLLYGLLKAGLDKKIELSLDIPSVGAAKLQAGEADFGLVPVAAIPEIKGAQIFSDYCIGAIGAVKTVCVYAHRPIEELTHIYLDFHSRTSVELTKLLVKDYWRLNPQFMPAKEGYIQRIKERVGGLVIGDRTMGLEEQFPYVYDLGKYWKKYTNLPFVFAAWVSTKPLSERFVTQFNEAMQMGVDAIPDLKYLLNSPHPNFDLNSYFTHNISYTLDAPKREALALFLESIQEQRELALVVG